MDMNGFWESFHQMLIAEGFLIPSELLAVIFGILYVVLATRENPWCWFWGILSCSLWAYASYFIFNLQIDAWLQVFYVCISFWGLYKWKFKLQDNIKIPVQTLPTNQHLAILGIGVLLSMVIGYLYATYSETASPYLDALTTVFSVITTFMVIHKVLENWLYWIIIDLLYAYLYYTREGYLFAFLMLLYTIIAIAGYLKWRKAYNLTQRA